MNKAVVTGITTVAIAYTVWLSQVRGLYDAPAVPALSVVNESGQRVGEYRPPPARDIIEEDNAGSIIYGMQLLNETSRLLPENVGNGLNCNSCHMAQGKLPLGAPYINTAAAYPRFMPRAQAVLDLSERINGCFRRSMDGHPLAEDSEEMAAMKAYIHWLSKDLEPGQHVEIDNLEYFDVSEYTPDPARGEILYARQCAACHGDHGEGMKDQFGDYIFPPLWGDDSFNIGAGMARLSRAAPFIKHNMPLGVSLEAPLGQVTLSNQDAVDLASYVTTQPRPDFPDKINDWPGVSNPVDARY